jgi:hypothetical protein
MLTTACNHPLSIERHSGQDGSWDAVFSTLTAAEGSGRKPAFTKTMKINSFAIIRQN